MTSRSKGRPPLPRKASRRVMDAVLVARCVECKSEREIFPGEIPLGVIPVCSKCFMPMIAAGAKVRVRA